MTYLSLNPDLPALPIPHWARDDGGGFFAAALNAFRFHKNLIINPDAFLTALIAQAGVLIAENPEIYRSDLVNHNGKRDIVAADADSMWDDFAENIDIRNEPFKRLLNLKFSTTTRDVLRARHGLIAATFSPFYNYVCTECGLRGVRIEGTADDWCRLKAAMNGFDFLHKIRPECENENDANPVARWIAKTKSVIDRCIEATNGDDDGPSADSTEWWKGFVTENAMSGGPYVGGHISGMMLIDRKGKVIEHERPRTFIPKDQMEVTVQFDYEREHKYVVGNFFCTSGEDCEAIPGIRLVSIDSKSE